MNLRRSVPMGVLLSVLIFAGTFGAKGLGTLVARHFGTNTHLARSIAAYTAMGLLSIAFMACFGQSQWRAFGFQKPKAPWLKFAAYGLLLGAATTLVVRLGHGRGMENAMKGIGPIQMILLITGGSAMEEIFMRGWLQGFLDPLREHRVGFKQMRCSVPVLTAALAFGAMHLTLAFAGVDLWSLFCLLGFTTTVGLLAGLARERTSSLGPPIVVHLAGNLGGILGAACFFVIQVLCAGHIPGQS